LRWRRDRVQLAGDNLNDFAGALASRRFLLKVSAILSEGSYYS